ncbi:MAG TPA: O-antigen ligase family protein [Victivallales bacterium]|nr:O-antigen ligase family protein [Victivallales bacterium]HRU01524.1 O-antigen ligase family protein [Victivallales bacterium]
MKKIIKTINKNLDYLLIFLYLLFTIVVFKILQDIKGFQICFAIFASAILLLKRNFSYNRKVTFIVPIIIFLITISIQYIIFDSYLAFEFFNSLSWLICPLFIYFISTNRYKILYILAFLWSVNCIVSMWQLYSGKMFTGLPGNWNWNASLILSLSPIVIFLLHFFSNLYEKRALHLCKYLVLLFVLFTIYQTGSRGAGLSMFFAILLYFYLESGISLRFKVIFSIVFTIFMLIIMILLIFSGYASHIISYDTRIPMWTGATKLIKDNFIIGVGDSSYLSVYTAYRPISYFLRSHHFAHITEHPHNHILYILGSFGIIGGSALLFLYLYPISIGIRRFKNLSNGSRAVLFSAILFFCCSLFDMTYYHWHNYFAISLVLGLLWRIIYIADSKESNCNDNLNFLYFFRSAIGIFLLFFFLKANEIIIKLNYYQNIGQILSDKYDKQALSLYFMEKARQTYPNSFYGPFGSGIVSIVNFKDPIMTEFYFNQLEKTPNPSISRSNLRMADAKIALGKNREALKYLEKDLINYPISIEALYKKFKLEESLGLKEEQAKTAKAISIALNYKGLDWEDLPIIAKNPYFDNKFEEYKLLKKKLAKEKNINQPN